MGDGDPVGVGRGGVGAHVEGAPVVPAVAADPGAIQAKLAQLKKIRLKGGKTMLQGQAEDLAECLGIDTFRHSC